jgi:PAS domain S-box-containing protein
MLGYSPEEVSHLHAWDWELQRTREQLRDMLRNIDETGNNFETQHRRKDGTAYDVEISANGAVFAGEKLIFCVCRDITERKRMERALKDRVEFEKIVAAISTSFINLAPDEIDAGIEDALRSIGEFFGVDRSYLFRLFDDGTKTDNTHEWCAPGIVPQIENLKGLQTADFPWFLGRLNRFETVRIPSVADLPPDAGAEKETLQSGDVQSSILVPMVYGGTLVGFIGIDSVRHEKSWSEENIALLRIVVEIFLNALERKRVMDALRSSETKFHAMFEENPLGAAIIDKERKIRDVNDAAAALIGRPRKEIIGRMCHEFIFPIAENDCPIYDHGLTIDHAEGILLSKDRGDVPIEKTATQITVGGDTMILEMFYDITKRKAAEEAVRESEEKYRNIIENIQDVFYRADIEGNLIMTSRSGAKLLGYDSVEEMIGLNVAKTFYAVPEERDEFLKILKEKGVVDDHEITLTKTDGTLVPVRMSSHFYFDTNGNPVGVEGLLSDITERKAAENALRESEERMRTMFEEAPLGIALIDSLTAHIYEVNPQFAKIIGRSREEMATIDWISITHPDDVQEDLDNMAMLNAGKITGFDMNKRYIQPDGSFVWINMTIAPLKVEDKTQPRHLCMIEDITERKAAEEELRKRADELEKFNRLAVGRELKMIELKKEINALLGESGKEPGYMIVGES